MVKHILAAVDSSAKSEQAALAAMDLPRAWAHS
jgi:hypothetical protein